MADDFRAHAWQIRLLRRANVASTFDDHHRIRVELGGLPLKIPLGSG